jgi:hypothetical protein
MTIADRESLMSLAERTLKIEPLSEVERGQMWALDKLAGNEVDRLILRATFWQHRAETLRVEGVVT